jgi:hypothetical protein
MHASETTYLIDQLKRLPSHGQTPPALQDILNQIKQLGDGANAVVQERVFQLLADQVQKVTDQVTILEQRNRGLQSSLRINIKSAAEVGQEIDKLSASYRIGSNLLRDYVGSLNSVVKGNAKYLTGLKDAGAEGKKFNEIILKQYDRNRLLLGLTEEQSNAYTKFLAVQGSTAEETEKYNDTLAAVASQIKEATGQTDAYADILTQIAEAGPTIQTAYAGAADEIARAAIKANRLGVTFKDLVSISDKFLDIESSISNELELQLLGGKKINSEKFREAAVNQDLESMSEALTEIIEQQGDAVIKNRFQREALAATLGIEEDKLMGIYQTLQANERVTGKTADDLANQLDNLTPGAPGVATTADEAAKAASILGTKEQQQLDANLAYTENILTSFPNQVKSIDELSTSLIDMQKKSLSLSGELTSLIDRMAGSNGVLTLLGGGIVANSIQDLYNNIKGANFNVTEAAIKATTVSISGLDTKNTGDAFFPSAGGNVIWSPKENAIFKPSANDEIAVAPGISNMMSGGGSSPNINVVIQGAGLDELISRIDIRKGERMNA